MIYTLCNGDTTKENSMKTKIRKWKNAHQYELYFALWAGIHVSGIALCIYDIKKSSDKK